MPNDQSASKTDVRSIESLKEQFEQLNRRKIQAQTQLENATQQLEELQREAIEQFGTSDVAELRDKLVEMEAENERRRREYQQLLDKISDELTQVEKDSSAQATANG